MYHLISKLFCITIRSEQYSLGEDVDEVDEVNHHRGEADKEKERPQELCVPSPGGVDVGQALWEKAVTSRWFIER